VLDADGNELEGEDVFELLKDLQGAFDDGKFPVFEAADGRVVIPVTGMGLWGPVWGYIALEKDMDTVAGIIMAHKGETPGLGDRNAEISGAVRRQEDLQRRRVRLRETAQGRRSGPRT
jgi:Na+-translocating ferredoxin:NAD+ oxidoreductase RnfG subunit